MLTARKKRAVLLTSGHPSCDIISDAVALLAVIFWRFSKLCQALAIQIKFSKGSHSCHTKSLKDDQQPRSSSCYNVAPLVFPYLGYNEMCRTGGELDKFSKYTTLPCLSQSPRHQQLLRRQILRAFASSTVNLPRFGGSYRDMQ